MGYIGVKIHLLTIDPNFLGHPSGGSLVVVIVGGNDTVDGRHRKNQLILYMVNIPLFTFIYKVLYIPGGNRRISEPSTVVVYHHSSSSHALR